MSIPRTRYAIMVDSIVGTVCGALVLGFFLMLWEGFAGLEKRMAETKRQLANLEAVTSATGDTMAEEVAKLRTGIRRLETQMRECHEGEPIEFPADDEEDAESALSIQRKVQKQVRIRTAENRSE